MQCGVHDCGATGVNDTLLDAPGNTWVAIRVINATHNLILTEYRGRLDPPAAEYANFTVNFGENTNESRFYHAYNIHHHL